MFSTRTATLVALLTGGCGDDSAQDEPGETDSLSSDTQATSDVNPCHAPLVRLQTGPDPDCAGDGNAHQWPVGLEPEDCHGWSATDPQGEAHLNSANDIRCEADGSFSFTQFAGTLDCSGSGVTKTFSLDVCQQDTPPVLYTKAVDLTCCASPTSPDCITGTPTITVPGGEIYLNTQACSP